MATLITVDDLTLNPVQAENASQAVFELVYNSEGINSLHTVVSGIERDQYIPIFGLLPVLGKCVTACGFAASSKSIPTSEKMWAPKLIGDKLEHCETDLDALFRVFKRSKKAKDYFDISDTEAQAFILARVEAAMKEMLWRFVDFGDTAIALTTGAGTLKVSDDFGVANFNCIDGKWKQLFAIATAAPAQRVTIGENTGANYADQMNLAAEAAYDVLRKMYEGADSRMFGQEGLHFEITRSLYNNWYAYRESKGFVATNENVANTTINQFRGIPIVVRDDWDRSIKQFFDNGTTYHYPHRAVLIANGNQPVGVMDEESLNSLKSWYSEDLEKNFVKFLVKMDVKILQDELVMVAY